MALAATNHKVKYISCFIEGIDLAELEKLGENGNNWEPRGAIR